MNIDYRILAYNYLRYCGDLFLTLFPKNDKQFIIEIQKEEHRHEEN